MISINGTDTGGTGDALADAASASASSTRCAPQTQVDTCKIDEGLCTIGDPRTVVSRYCLGDSTIAVAMYLCIIAFSQVRSGSTVASAASG